MNEQIDKNSVTLFDFIQVLRKKIVLICGLIFLFAVCTLILASVLPKTYRTKVVISSPSPSDVEVINIPDLYQISADEMIEEMYNNLQNYEIRHQYFMENNLYDHLKKGDVKYNGPDDAYNREFRENITVRQVLDKKKGVVAIIVSLEGGYPLELAEWLNSYVDKVDMFTVSVIKNALNTAVLKKVQDLEQRIKLVRETARKKRTDEIFRLEEALLIAEKIGLEEPFLFSSLINNQSILNNPEKFNANGYSSNREYLQGAKALRAQIEVLKKRTKDDSFIPELRGMEEELTYLQTYNVSKVKFHAARIGEEAQEPQSPYKPNVKLLVIVGVIMGVLVAILFAYAKTAYENSMIHEE